MALSWKIQMFIQIQQAVRLLLPSREGVTAASTHASCEIPNENDVDNKCARHDRMARSSEVWH